MAEFEKDTSVLQTVEALCRQFGDRIRFVDYWDADLTALGVEKAGSPGWLVYFSTCGCEPGRYYVDLELPPAEGSDLPYEQGESFQDVDFDTLVSIVSQRLGLPLSRCD